MGRAIGSGRAVGRGHRASRRAIGPGRRGAAAVDRAVGAGRGLALLDAREAAATSSSTSAAPRGPRRALRRMPASRAPRWCRARPACDRRRGRARSAAPTGRGAARIELQPRASWRCARPSQPRSRRCRRAGTSRSSSAITAARRTAPSGTALTLARDAASARGLIGRRVPPRPRGTAGPRPAREIGLHAVRGGSWVGDHAVLLAGEGESARAAPCRPGSRGLRARRARRGTIRGPRHAGPLYSRGPPDLRPRRRYIPDTGRIRMHA